MDTEARTIYDNAFGSFSEIPNAQNFTSLENTFSQQESERKVKSVQSPFSPKYRNKEMADELWRFVYIQANAVEEFLQVDEEYNQEWGGRILLIW